ncbi:hypothetical protein NZK35_03385 [Stieleria sp. ICT_E10.1]|uniref:hypothetical protein n=1 Tax=Stieleria sedimenti TaxID=2976331 RepID=UPI00217FBE38|nr:hypothetical protein [Stieleria sedimenti]MCS7465716.1 hypothetical protein [Stieleria sedimenti]
MLVFFKKVLESSGVSFQLAIEPLPSGPFALEGLAPCRKQETPRLVNESVAFSAGQHSSGASAFNVSGCVCRVEKGAGAIGTRTSAGVQALAQYRYVKLDGEAARAGASRLMSNEYQPFAASLRAPALFTGTRRLKVDAPLAHSRDKEAHRVQGTP